MIIFLYSKHRAAMTGVKDFENGWKLGVEASYNGKIISFRLQSHSFLPVYRRNDFQRYRETFYRCPERRKSSGLQTK
jgi:hypothetical protein